MRNRAKLWESTVQNSLTWALESTRGSQGNLQILRAAQRRQFVRMIGSTRRVLEGGVLEDWVVFQKRVYRRAIEIIDDCGLDVGKFLKQKKLDFIGHVSRFGLGDMENHMVKHIILWRPITWWRMQQKAILDGDPFVHPRVGKIKRFEDQFPGYWVHKFSKQALQ